MSGGSILSCFRSNPHGHEQVLKEDDDNKIKLFVKISSLHFEKL